MQGTHSGGRKSIPTHSPPQLFRSKLCEIIILFRGKYAETHKCIVYGRIAVGTKLRQQGMTNAVALDILLIIRHIMAGTKIVLSDVRLNLSTCRKEKWPQVHAVPHTHSGKPRRPRPAKDAHQHRLCEIARMMGKCDAVALLTDMYPMEEVIAADTCRCLHRALMCARIIRHIPRLDHARNMVLRTIRGNSICVRP